MEHPEYLLTSRLKWAYRWLPENGAVLDIGSSASYLSMALPHKASHAVCVDVEFEPLRILHAEASGLMLIQCSATQLPLRETCFDAVLLLDVLEHIAMGDEERVIREAERVLRYGGAMIISVPAKGLFSFLDPQNLKAWLTGRLNDSTRHRHYRLAEIRRMLGESLTLERIHRGGLFLSPLMFALDNWLRKHLGLDLGKTLRKISDIDYAVPWGPASYHMILLVRKREPESHGE